MNVLFVCTANVCRSPMAEAIFNDLAEERGLDAVAASAGVRALVGHGITENAREALAEIGVMAGEHLSRRISGDIAAESDLILTMEPEHARYVQRLPDAGDKVFTVVQYTGGSDTAEVPDPYGMGLFTYRTSVRQIFGYVEKVIERLEKGRA